jgi:hypothetical protein
MTTESNEVLAENEVLNTFIRQYYDNLIAAKASGAVPEGTHPVALAKVVCKITGENFYLPGHATKELYDGLLEFI